MKFKEADVVDGFCVTRKKFFYRLFIDRIGSEYLGCKDKRGNYYAIEKSTAVHSNISKTKLYKALKD